MEMPVAMPGKALFSAGNLAAQDERPARVVTPLDFAAAGMALCERRWFHVARLRKYRDLCEAFSKHDCEGVVFVPILPQLPSSAVPPASNGMRHLPVLPALGVLTLGVDSSTVVDARLLTSLFLLAHLVAQQLMNGEGYNMLMSMRGLSLSDTSHRAPCQSQVSASEETFTCWEDSLQNLQAGCAMSGNRSEYAPMSRWPSAESGIRLQPV
ncbi:g5203 [Coccomyxa elongata]